MERRHYKSKSKSKSRNSLKGRRRVKVNLSKRKQRKKGIGRYSSRVKKQLNDYRRMSSINHEETEIDQRRFISSQIQRYRLPRVTKEQYNKLKYLLFAYGIPGLAYILQQIAESGLSYDEFYSIYGLGVGIEGMGNNNNVRRYKETRFTLNPLRVPNSLN